MRKLRSLATLMLLAPLIASSDLFFAQCTVNTGTTPVGAWIAIPNVPSYDFGAGAVPLRKVEDLCAALTAAGAAGVTISQHFHANGETYTWDCVAAACAADPPALPIPESNCCGSACFCLDPGEGYEVHSTAAATATILGTDVTTFYTIPGSFVASEGLFGILLSLPCGTSMTAQELCTLAGIGIAEGNVAQVNAATGTALLYNCGTSIGNFSLVSGRAVRVRKTSAGSVTFSNGITTGPQLKQYCISGASDGVGWSWWVDVGADGLNSASEPNNATAGPIAAGSPAAAFATEFVTDINSVCPGTATTGFMSNCFVVAQPTDFDFWIGPSGGPLDDCKVSGFGLGAGGCAFNPLIYLNQANSVPTMSTVGYLVLIVLLLASGGILLARQQRKRAVHRAGE